jgi:hypothetical protein
MGRSCVLLGAVQCCILLGIAAGCGDQGARGALDIARVRLEEGDYEAARNEAVRAIAHAELARDEAAAWLATRMWITILAREGKAGTVRDALEDARVRFPESITAAFHVRLASEAERGSRWEAAAVILILGMQAFPEETPGFEDGLHHVSMRLESQMNRKLWEEHWRIHTGR